MTLRERIDAEQKGKNPVTSKRFETGIGLCRRLLTHFADENANIKLIVGDEAGEPAQAASTCTNALNE